MVQDKTTSKNEEPVRARDTIPAEPNHMGPQEKYQLTFVGKRERINAIFAILRKYDVIHGITPVALRNMLQELGPTFVKVGQILSTRSEFLSLEYREELATLRTNVDPVPFDVVKQTLEDEFNRPLKSMFSSIDPKPLGSASIAQVHHATLLDGTPVAIKVQRPGVQQVMAQDIDIMRSIARVAEHFVGSEQFVNLSDVVEELWRSFKEETNFLMEAQHLTEFYEFNLDDPHISCPRPIPDLCAEHVVTMDYLSGISIADPEKLTAAGYNLQELGNYIVESYSKQVLDDGYFHADPHGGNLIVSDGVVYFIDLGMMGRLSSRYRRILQDIVFAVAQADTPKLKDALMSLAVSIEPSKIDHSAFLHDLDYLVEDYASTDLTDLNVGELLTNVIKLARKHNVELPSVITLVARGMVTLEGLLEEYIPNVNMIEIISNHMSTKYSAVQELKDYIENTSQQSVKALEGLLHASEDIGLATHLLTRGQLKIKTEMAGSDDLMRRLGFIIDRLSLAVIIAGLFIGSSVVYYADIRPVIMGIPVLGFFGYIIALVMSCLVLKDIWRNSHPKNR